MVETTLIAGEDAAINPTDSALSFAETSSGGYEATDASPLDAVDGTIDGVENNVQAANRADYDPSPSDPEPPSTGGAETTSPDPIMSDPVGGGGISITSTGPGPGATPTGPGGLLEDVDGGVVAAALALIGLAAAIAGGSS